jgi:hypothetical protein
LLLYSAITPKSEDKYVVKVFNSTELHFSEVYFFQNWYFSPTYSVYYKSKAPSKELCTKMALGELGVSLS